MREWKINSGSFVLADNGSFVEMVMRFPWRLTSYRRIASAAFMCSEHRALASITQRLLAYQILLMMRWYYWCGGFSGCRWSFPWSSNPMPWVTTHILKKLRYDRLQLFNSKCLSVLLYGLEACSLNKSDQARDLNLIIIIRQYDYS